MARMIGMIIVDHITREEHRRCGRSSRPCTPTSGKQIADGAVALVDRGRGSSCLTIGVWSDRCGEFVESCRHT
jgi:hypothetical protein